jgi:NAD(P)-dependent dehydrogenase (short-subunit alcohol dehydrogenase family)
MAKRGTGSIVNVASIHGMVSPDFSIYGATGLTSPANYAFEKGGMIQFTRYLAVLLAPYNVRANCLSPGGLHSPLMPDEFVTNYCRRTPLRRMAEPSDIKGAAVFLASDASAYITGHNLAVDGGYTAL